MPLYEYECRACHRRTEKIQKFSDPELTTCPHCGGTLERTLTAPAVHFAGGGWYKDLYSSAKPTAAGEGSAKPAAGGEGAPAGGEAPKAAPSSEPATATASAPAAPAPSTPSK